MPVIHVCQVKRVLKRSLNELGTYVAEVGKLLGHEVRGPLSPLVLHDGDDEVAALEIPADGPRLEFRETCKNNIHMIYCRYCR